MLSNAATIRIQVTVNKPIDIVWYLWTTPKHVKQWNNASADWHTTHATNELKAGGRFSYTMAAKDGSVSFDFGGCYTAVDEYRFLAYTLDDNRKVTVKFEPIEGSTLITEIFEPESENTIELQQTGWQAILDNFKQHAEAFGKLERLGFSTIIAASPTKVYHTMLNKPTYEKWTAVFGEGSSFAGDWQEGSTIKFVAPGKDGKLSGIISTIDRNTPNEAVIIRHWGMIKDGVDITDSPELAEWAGAKEEYYFKPSENGTLLSVAIDVNNNYCTYFEDSWPKALAVLKSIAEE